jgi:hypothetical protein
MIFCEQRYISVGGGSVSLFPLHFRYIQLTQYSDGHYGLWLDDNLEKGISSTCLTFGNEPLSDEGSKFDVMGVELWFLGA